MASPTLVHLPQSAFSEKARWALDHHGIAYRALEHVPMLFEPMLRIMSRELRKKPSVPMLVDGSFVARDSLSVALYAEQRGNGKTLFPASFDRTIYAWNDHADRLLEAARSRMLERLLTNDAALLEAVPPRLARLGSALLPVARMATSFLIEKYGTRRTPAAALEATMSSVLEKADAVVTKKEYLVADEFTFADIAVASALGMIAPHPRQPLGPASRTVWSEPQFTAAFPGLISWRDRIVEQHR